MAQTKTISKRNIVVFEGAVRDSVILVLKGVLKLSTSLRDGRTQIVGLRFPGDVVTTRSFGEPWFATVEVVKTATLCIFGERQLDDLRLSSPDFNEEWNIHVSREISIAQGHLVTLGQKTPLERLAAFLLELRDRCIHATAQIREILIPISRDDIGAYLGLESETVSRQFTRLKDIGLIKMISPCRIVVGNWQALERLSDGEAAIAAV